MLSVKKIYLKMAESGATAGFNFGVWISTYPLMIHKIIGKPKQEADSASTNTQLLRAKPTEGGPGSGPQPGQGHSQDAPDSQRKQPNVLAHWSYTGDRYKAGVRIPKEDLPERVPQSRVKPRESSSRAVKIGNVKTRTHLREAVKSSDAGTRFKVILIQEGLGNLRDCFYYSKEALQNSTSVFEGKKCYADHPTAIDEEIRPERSTRDILGHFENVTYQEDKGRGQMVADLVTVSSPTTAWAQELLSTAIQFAKKYQDENLEFVGLSINANGQATETSLSDFVKESKLPASVLPKIQSAQAEGIDTIRVVHSLRDAVSCDLVTEAGAGGKIIQMIEMEKKPMKNKTKESDLEKKENSDVSAADKNAVAGQKLGDATVDHADVSQDKALFQKMIQQYLGEDADENDEAAMSMAKEAYESHKEDGLEHEAAYEAAGKHLAMAMKIGKKMHQKQQQSDVENKDSKATPKEAPLDQEADSGVESDESEEKKEKSKESNSKLIQALGENARLRESLKKYELNDYLDKKLAESKKSNLITKKFREALGAPKSKDQIDSALKLFLSGTEVSVTESEEESVGFVFTDKIEFKESDVGAEGSMSDCIE